VRIPDMGKVMSEHHRIQSESHAGAPSPQRQCTGTCGKRRSWTQFDGASTVCKQCVRRTPKKVGGIVNA